MRPVWRAKRSVWSVPFVLCEVEIVYGGQYLRPEKDSIRKNGEIKRVVDQMRLLKGSQLCDKNNVQPKDVGRQRRPT
jgi:hypothetical protein